MPQKEKLNWNLALQVPGVGKARARAIKEGLSRLAETSILDRYT